MEWNTLELYRYIKDNVFRTIQNKKVLFQYIPLHIIIASNKSTLVRNISKMRKIYKSISHTILYQARRGFTHSSVGTADYQFTMFTTKNSHKTTTP